MDLTAWTLSNMYVIWIAGLVEMWACSEFAGCYVGGT